MSWAALEAMVTALHRVAARAFCTVWRMGGLVAAEVLLRDRRTGGLRP